MRPIKNTHHAFWNVGDRVRFTSEMETVFTIVDIQPCDKYSCPDFISNSCSGHFLIPDNNDRMGWHDIKRDFIKVDE